MKRNATTAVLSLVLLCIGFPLLGADVKGVEVRRGILTDQVIADPYMQWALSKMRWELNPFAMRPDKQVRNGTFNAISVVEYSDGSDHLLLGDTPAYLKSELPTLATRARSTVNAQVLTKLSADPHFEGFCTLVYSKPELEDNAQLYLLRGKNFGILRLLKEASTDASWWMPGTNIENFPPARWTTLSQGGSGRENVYCLNFVSSVRPPWIFRISSYERPR